MFWFTSSDIQLTRANFNKPILMHTHYKYGVTLIVYNLRGRELLIDIKKPHSRGFWLNLIKHKLSFLFKIIDNYRLGNTGYTISFKYRLNDVIETFKLESNRFL